MSKSFKRIVIIGSSSSGKSTLGNKLSSILNIPHRELDFFFWEENWTEASTEVFRSRVDNFTAQEQWIVDGNFATRVSDIAWARATHIIWLDYPLSLILKQFITRSITRSFKRELLWGKCRESLWNSILKPNSLLIWILKTYKRNRKRFTKLMNTFEFPNATFIHLRYPKETIDLIEDIKKAQK